MIRIPDSGNVVTEKNYLKDPNTSLLLLRYVISHEKDDILDLHVLPVFERF